MQIKYAYFLFFSLVLICCKKEQLDFRYYPSKNLYDKSKLVAIDLDTITLNFKKITGEVRQIYKENKTPIIEIIDNSIKKRIIPLVFGEMRKRDVLSITSDSILVDKGYSISKLKPILKRHYLNNGKDYRYPRSFKNALVEITIDTSKNGKDLMKSLINLTRVFDEVNMEIKDTIELKIFFNYFRQIPPPPLYLETDLN